MRFFQFFLLLALVPAGLYGQPSKIEEMPAVPQPEKSRGVPAYPYLTEAYQPDGSKIMLKGRGDRTVNWFETKEGFTVVRDSKGNFVYAGLDADEQLVPTEFKVGRDEASMEQPIKHLVFSKQQIQTQREKYYNYPQSKANPSPFPSSGTNNVLVILVDFPDLPATLTPGDFDNLMNQPGFNGTGSFRDYYLDMSYNNLTLESTVVPWVRMSENLSYYGSNDEFGYDLRPHVMVREAIDSLEANGFDFSPYDNDGDGYVDEVIVTHAGYGEEFPGTSEATIWSHAYHLADLVVEYDGVMIDNYLAVPELYGNSGSEINIVGTVVHEFSHSLGIPDLYDIDFDGSGGHAFDLNFWDLMAVGSWNDDGYSPAGINAWLKSYMGWLNITQIDTTGTFLLNAAIDHPEAFRLNTPVYNEYFILENRQQTGFDRGLPGNGMLIYHVDLNYEGWLTGFINVDPSHQGFDLEEADNIRDTVSLAGDAFPGTANVTAFDSLTSPSSLTWNGNNSNVAIREIASDAGVISFTIGNTTLKDIPDDWSVEELQYTQNGTLIGEVIIGSDTVATGYLGAFVDTVCRGVASISYVEETGNYLFNLVVFSNATGSETLEFRYHDPVADTTIALYETLSFHSDTIAGTLSAPYYFHTPVTFSKQIVTGWNWFSVNVEAADMSPAHLFSQCISPNSYVKNQTQSTTLYAGYGWFGNLDALRIGDLYKMESFSPCEINFEGVPARPMEHSIDLVPGWNWISYVPRQAMPINDALASMNPTQLDYIKNQTSAASYYDSYGWYGNLDQLTPGEGYMLRLAAGDVLQYPDSPGGTRKKLAVSSAQGVNLPAFNPFAYPHNGSITARISVDGLPLYSESDVLSAWVDGECRGAVSGRFFDPGNAVFFPLLIHGNDYPEEVVFKFYHGESEKTFECVERIIFEKDMIVGNAFEPVELSIESGELGLEDRILFSTDFAVYPNPVSEILTIDFIIPATADIEIEVYDIYGNLVDVLVRDTFSPGKYAVRWNLPDGAASTYLVRMSDGHSASFKRIIHID